jgi:hypothetical protein
MPCTNFLDCQQATAGSGDSRTVVLAIMYTAYTKRNIQRILHESAT